jgi:putative hydroxymethylpyrimidine transport system ATP-binding protein
MTPPPAIAVEGTARIAGTPLFGPLRLEVGAGEWTCLLGPSGVGKSSLLRLIAGLETGIDFDGRVTTSDGAPLAGRIAYMAQSDLLFPWLDVTGNTLVGARLRREPPDRARAARLIARVGLIAHQAKRPAELSGGQRQRAALARALMEHRPVILLDEPFSALDARTRAEMQDLAADLLAGRTVLLVTHDPAEAARLGHRIFVLDETGLAEVPPPATPPVRPVAAPETMSAQAALFAALRGAVP